MPLIDAPVAACYGFVTALKRDSTPMVMAAFYFQLHQPMRLHPERDKFLWDEMNREIFLRTAEKCYFPATRMFTELVTDYPHFKIVMSMSGTFLEQAEMYSPGVIGALQKLLDIGESQVEFLDETYYHSLTGLFSDEKKQEFRDQVSLHRDLMKRLFGIRPISFRNTELIFNNSIADVVDDMGYLSILCDRRTDMILEDGRPAPLNVVLKAMGSDLVIIPRNKDLSDEIVFRFPHQPVSAEDYAARIASAEGEVVLLGFDYGHLGDPVWEDKGIFEFWRGLPGTLAEHSNVEIATTTEIAERFRKISCPVVCIQGASATCAEADPGAAEWIGNPTQLELFRDIERLEPEAKKGGDELLRKWRYLTTSDHLYFMHEPFGEDHVVHTYFNPYGGSIAAPAHIITRKIDGLEMTIKRFQVLRKRERTVVLMISPETGKLPEEMGALAQYITGKSGGQGEVVSALCNGLVERGIEVHLATLNLKRRFQRESGMDEAGWRNVRYRLDPDRIHLVSSAVFAENMSAYSGNPLLTAAEFQSDIVNNIIKTVRAKSEGKLLLHTHDWMAGGAIVAYAKSTGLPVLHTVHNIFTGNIPLDMMNGIDIGGLSQLLFFSEQWGRKAVDSQATSIKSATLINFVGEQFLHEVVNDFFLDRAIIPWSVRQEVKAKYYHNSALSIINAPAPYMYPERCDWLIRKYGVEDDVLQAKRENRAEFQKRTGLLIDPDAILFYWPSRLDPNQKGVDLIEDIALKFVIDHGDVQIAFIADGVGGDRNHIDILGKIAMASGGKICIHPYSEDLSMLGFAAASDVFGASLYEPCGQIDQVGNLFGATATNRDTGGYHDKIRELRLKIAGSPQDVGNGFLFRNYDSTGLWYAMHNSVEFHRLPASIREGQIIRIMREARDRFDLGSMIAQYIRAYERLNQGKPLV